MSPQLSKVGKVGLKTTLPRTELKIIPHKWSQEAPLPPSWAWILLLVLQTPLMMDCGCQYDSPSLLSDAACDCSCRHPRWVDSWAFFLLFDVWSRCVLLVELVLCAPVLVSNKDGKTHIFVFFFLSSYFGSGKYACCIR